MQAATSRFNKLPLVERRAHTPALSMDSRGVFLVVVVVVAAAASGVGGDFAADRAECSDKLVALATCLTYVQGQAPAPTPDCCAGLKTVLQSSRKCLCVLVKDRDEPDLGIKINVTRALALPSLCSAPANISDCPRLLNLPPGSKDAEVFEQFGKQQGAPASPGGGASSAPSTGTHKSAAAGPATRARWSGMGGAGAAAAAAAALSLFFFLDALPLAVLLLG